MSRLSQYLYDGIWPDELAISGFHSRRSLRKDDEVPRFARSLMQKIHLNDVFLTVQGEGANAGRRSLFVRMPFCNLKCPWCDTEFNSFNEWDTQDFINFAASASGRFAVLTGGEPSMHKHTPTVIEILKSLGYEIAMESNGMFPPPKGVDWLTVSPKGFSNNPYSIAPPAFVEASEFKYVIDEGFDWKVLERHGPTMSVLKIVEGDRETQFINGRAMLYLSPEHTRMDRNVVSILRYQEMHPWWRLSLQTHKWIGAK